MNGPERDEVLRYLERWQGAADLLRLERAQRLRAMTDEGARGEIAVLGDLWRSGFRDLGGDGLIQVQRVFGLYHDRGARS